MTASPQAAAPRRWFARRAEPPAKLAQFDRKLTPWLFVAPQLLIVAIFFYWPSVQAVTSSFYLEDPFGFGASFVGLDNYREALGSAEYRQIAGFTAFFAATVTALALGLGLLLAVKADAVLRGAGAYKTALISVYAIAPPVVGLIGMMMFDMHIGPFTRAAAVFGWDLKVGIDYWDTAIALITVAVWKQIPYNFIFFLSGLQAVPSAVREAARIDATSGWRQFRDVTLPLLAPTAFFLLVINITYALFDTFGIIDVMVKDKPANNPVTLVYKVYLDGFKGNDIGGSSAQSVILMIVVATLTLAQFRLIERRVHYG
ncbi:carbohydrate ABC transporter permease [Rhodobacter capsulatus]|jgi:sn-glycerol 3-phosphate transport system permease protein|uniref:sn-glycerol-3-phosphate transport system permease protein UgpA n=1 Tax=Rhodobacter capsulatus (strain ATCC BAA-309 / NBRC 16581 / SB1003) TaxID=272942 RepID=D5AQX7_RHOCB|nr:sugar ABC transporter permease [Rhodobacter capsulatus]ADE84783.1 sn-glycerol-3-phosphate transport system permease protein UgpA [Rhodobacter capsulatus SB 1003]ETD02254.1 glycerol-3-phosphate transporter permease [Rhodobacter capsulatus DE442]ETD78337.1 glycerol-3-phosphate transporter permease [Rhodobacter capsulatus R121]ETE54452.1 glycerol-3-phosphate transporter permease [Rhodobacter capsulatus Y262]MDS0926531.1 sugar ABC transporter permease [Rhodobacter capsulatus]